MIAGGRVLQTSLRSDRRLGEDGVGRPNPVGKDQTSHQFPEDLLYRFPLIPCIASQKRMFRIGQFRLDYVHARCNMSHVIFNMSPTHQAMRPTGFPPSMLEIIK